MEGWGGGGAGAPAVKTYARRPGARRAAKARAGGTLRTPEQKAPTEKRQSRLSEQYVWLSRTLGHRRSSSLKFVGSSPDAVIKDNERQAHNAKGKGKGKGKARGKRKREVEETTEYKSFIDRMNKHFDEVSKEVLKEEAQAETPCSTPFLRLGDSLAKLHVRPAAARKVDRMAKVHDWIKGIPSVCRTAQGAPSCTRSRHSESIEPGWTLAAGTKPSTVNITVRPSCAAAVDRPVDRTDIGRRDCIEQLQATTGPSSMEARLGPSSQGPPLLNSLNSQRSTRAMRRGQEAQGSAEPRRGNFSAWDPSGTREGSFDVVEIDLGGTGNTMHKWPICKRSSASEKPGRCVGKEIINLISKSPSAGANGLSNNRHSPTPVEKVMHELGDLDKLLRICGQQTSEQLPSMEATLRQNVLFKKALKIGEGTFGEAFKFGDIVVKILPLDGDMKINGEPQKTAAEVLVEAHVALTLSALREGASPEPQSNITDGFVYTKSVALCRGPYPKTLVKAWKKYESEMGSDNDPVSGHNADQLYIIFFAENGGQDLESFELQTFEEARSVLFQVALTLAVGEAAHEFEHRDLHWGNLVLQRTDNCTTWMKLSGEELRASNGGIKVALIDFTMSRARTAGGVVSYTDVDPELYGESQSGTQEATQSHDQNSLVDINAKHQSKVYRDMYKLTQGQWEQYFPKTNCLWMNYLAKIVAAKMKSQLGKRKLSKWSQQNLKKIDRFGKCALDCSSCIDLVKGKSFLELVVDSEQRHTADTNMAPATHRPRRTCRR